MSQLTESTLIMVDDNVDEIFLTRRKVRSEGIINRFVSEKKPERLFQSMDELIEMGVEKDSFVILLDINMPRVNGFETLKMIRSHPVYNKTPVFMLSSSKSDEDMLEAEELGCDGYIVKPFTSEEFFAELQNIQRVKKKIFNDPKSDRTAPSSETASLSAAPKSANEFAAA